MLRVLLPALVAASLLACGTTSETFELPPFKQLSAPERRPAADLGYVARLHHVSKSLDLGALEDTLLRSRTSTGLKACYDEWLRATPRGPAKVDLAFAFAESRFPFVAVMIGASTHGLDRQLERCFTGWLSSPQTWSDTPPKTGLARLEIQLWR